MRSIIKKLFQIKKQKVYHMVKAELLEVKAKVKCNVVFIDENNYDRVLDMREETVVSAFRYMLKDGQLGIFAEIKSI